MSWAVVIALALAGLGLAIVLFRLPRKLWAGLAAALVFGLAGYALQANPGLPSAPKAPQQSRTDLGDFDLVAQRREFIAESDQSRADFLITADAMARRGQFDDAASFLAGVTRENPQDFEAWIALGNALVEHADGALTQPAVYAFNNAANLKPDHPAPGYFVGVSLIRQSRFTEAREMWVQAFVNAPDDAAGKAGLAERLQRLDGMLAMMAEAEAMQQGQPMPNGGTPPGAGQTPPSGNAPETQQ